MPTQQQDADATAANPEEGAPAATDDASAAGAAAADTGAPAGADAGAQADGAEGGEGKQEPEKTPEQLAEEKAAAEAKEAELKTAAEKYAKEQISQANRTMAAARRAQAAVESVKTENVALKKENEVYGGFVQQLQKEPLTAIGRLGFKTLKEFIDHCIATGGEPRELSDDDKIAAAVRKAIDEREAPARQREQEAAVGESQRLVFAFIDEHKDGKYALTAKPTGKAELWGEILRYFDKHGTCPDEAVTYLADRVEKRLRADFGEPKVTPSPGGKQGNPATGAAAPGASKSGKSLAGQSMSGAPTARKYSDDPDERTAQINAELRAEGLL